MLQRWICLDKLIMYMWKRCKLIDFGYRQTAKILIYKKKFISPLFNVALRTICSIMASWLKAYWFFLRPQVLHSTIGRDELYVSSKNNRWVISQTVFVVKWLSSISYTKVKTAEYIDSSGQYELENLCFAVKQCSIIMILTFFFL